MNSVRNVMELLVYPQKDTIKLSSLKSDTNEFFMFILPNFTELLDCKFYQKDCLFFLLYYIIFYVCWLRYNEGSIFNYATL